MLSFLCDKIAACLGTKSEKQVLNVSHIFASFTPILLLFGPEFQYSCKMRQDEEVKQSNKAAIRDLALTFCPTMSMQRPTKETQTLDACMYSLLILVNTSC